MSTFAQNNTDVADVTDDNIEAGFEACPSDGFAMPMTTRYVNAAFKWVCGRIESVSTSLTALTQRLDGLSGANIGPADGFEVFSSRVNDVFNFRKIRVNKGLKMSQGQTLLTLEQTVLCCYSDANLSGGAPSNSFIANILVDDVTDPDAPVTYIWSCTGNTYVPLSAGTPVNTSTPTGNGWTTITSTVCDAPTGGTFDNTDNTFTYTVTVTAGLAIDAIFVNGVATTNGFQVPNDTDNVSVTVSGTGTGIVTGSMSIFFDDGNTQQGTAVNIPVSLDCTVANTMPSVPSATLSIDCANMPETITGFAGATSITATSNVGTSSYTVTPNASNTQVVIDGNGGNETLTLVASNGTTADDATMVVTVTGCGTSFNSVCTSPATRVLDVVDLGGDTQTHTFYDAGCGTVAGCGWSVGALTLFRVQHSNGNPTTHTLLLNLTGNSTNLQSITFISAGQVDTVVSTFGNNNVSLSQQTWNTLVAHVENPTGYQLEYTCT